MSKMIDFPFSRFAVEATERNYEPVKYSGTGYLVKSRNGVRVELQTTGGGVVGVGYGSSAAAIEVMVGELDTAPLNWQKTLKGSVNFAFDSIEKFFDMVSWVEGLSLPEKGKGGRPRKVTSETVTASVEAATVVSSDEIKASNLDRIKEAAEKAREKRNERRRLAYAAKKAQTEADEAIDEMAPDMTDVPNFLQGDIGGRQPGAE